MIATLVEEQLIKILGIDGRYLGEYLSAGQLTFPGRSPEATEHNWVTVKTTWTELATATSPAGRAFFMQYFVWRPPERPVVLIMVNA